MSNLPERNTDASLSSPSSQLGYESFIPNVEPPIVEGLSYSFEAGISQVWPDGQFASDVSINVSERPEQLQKFLDSSQTVAWVDFYGKAMTRIRHSEQVNSHRRRLDPNSLFDRPNETLYGDRVAIGPTKYLADRTESGLTFLTEEQVLEEGKLRPYMASWLGALANRGRFYSALIDNLSHLL